jgi:hypothetical protein
LTTVLDEPYPGDTVVSRAPKMWTLGQLIRFSMSDSTGTARALPARRENVKMLEIIVSMDIDQKCKLVVALNIFRCEIGHDVRTGETTVGLYRSKMSLVNWRRPFHFAV